MKRAVMILALAALAGCWREIGTRYVDPDYPNQHVIKLAVLPVINLTEQPLTTTLVMQHLVTQLTREKKYDVQPMATTMARLRAGGGAAAYSQLMTRVGVGEDGPAQLYNQIARDLEVDGLFEEKITAFHHFREDGIGASSNGSASYQQFPVTVVEVKALLWGVHSGNVLWRDEAMQRYYHEPAAAQSYAVPVEQATRQLLDRFPTNAWAPSIPATPTPVPAPVTSYYPFPTPADPNP
ncbi:MAG: hypothetical protein JWM80_4939 [Cyanobacteria bacterium RYN_339]|nr:hypothetical protein [Cyanobacteria bacterium RYN_339]